MDPAMVHHREVVMKLARKLGPPQRPGSNPECGHASKASVPVNSCLWVPRTSSTSCDQAVFVDHATDARVSSDTVLLKIDRFG